MFWSFPLLVKTNHYCKNALLLCLADVFHPCLLKQTFRVDFFFHLVTSEVYFKSKFTLLKMRYSGSVL